MARDEQRYCLQLVQETLGGEPFKEEKTFDFLRGDPTPKRPEGTKLPVDGYFPGLKLAVEYREKQHRGQGPKLWDKRITATGVDRKTQREIYDRRREEVLPRRGIKLLIVHDNELSFNKEEDMRLLRERLREIGCEV